MTAGDGTALVSDVYLPAGDGPFPTLLYRVRGSKDSSFITGTLMLSPIIAASRGYAVVVNQVRGRGRSTGEWHPFVHEESDGLDALEWTLTQSWCNGSVGVYGSAYAGANALLLTATGHEAIKACVAFVTGANYHDGWIYTSGALELGWDNFWAYLTAGESLQRLELPAAESVVATSSLEVALKNPTEMMNVLPLRDQPALTGISDHYQVWLDHPHYDEYWEAIDVIAKANKIQAAVLNISGWWDNFLGSHLQLYRALAERSPRGDQQRLIIGPWDHFTYVGIVPTRAGERTFGPQGLAGNAVVGPLTLDWMDRWLQGAEPQEDTAPGLRYFAAGSDEWRVADTWPPPHTPQRWHLRSEGALRTEAPGEESPDTFVYDPADPTPTVGGRTLMPTVTGAGIEDQATVGRRFDVLGYDSDPLDSAVEIAGPVEVELWASTSAVDTDFTAKLVDVAPDGYASFVADGIVRGRHRRTTREDEWLKPGDVYRFDIDLWGAAWRFEVGHRIRVEIASCNFPRFDRNLNAALPVGEGTLAEAVVAEQTIYHDTARPSSVVLSITDA